MAIQDSFQDDQEQRMFPDEVIEQKPLLPVWDDSKVVGLSPKYTELGNRMTSYLAAMAQKRMNGSEEPLGVSFDQYSDLLERGEENYIRDTLATQSRSKEVQNATGMQEQYIRNPPPGSESGALLDMLIKEQELLASPANQNALELEGLREISAEAAQDAEQANMLQQMIDNGEIDAIHASAFKHSLLERELDKVQQELQGQGWLETITDMLMVPTDYLFGFTGVVPGNESSFTQTPWTNLAEEIEFMFNKPAEEFAADLPEFIENVKKQSAWIGENTSYVYEVLNTYKSSLSPRDAMIFATIGLTDVAQLPLIRAGKIITQPARLMRVLGNRKGAVDTVANTIMKDSSEIPQELSSLNISVRPVDALVDSLPNSVKLNAPDMQSPLVGISGEVSRRLDEIKALAVRARRAVQAKQSPEEMAQMIAASEKEFATEWQGAPVYQLTPDGNDWRVTSASSTKTTRAVVDPLQSDPNIHEYIRLRKLTDAAEKNSNPSLWTAAERAAYDSGDWATFSKLRGYTKKEISTYRKMLASFKKIQKKHGDKVAEGLFYSPKFEPTIPKKTISVKRPVFTELDSAEDIESFMRRQVDEETGIVSLSMDIGKGRGTGGYTSHARAMRAAVDKGLDVEDIAIIPSVDGKQFFIRIFKDVVETDMSVVPSTTQGDIHWVGRLAPWWFREKIGDPTTVLLDYHASARINAILAQSNIKVNVLDPLYKAMRLRNKEFRQMSEVLQIGVDFDNGPGRSSGKWFNKAELDGVYWNQFKRKPSEKEQLAYYAYKELSDLDWHLKNADLYSLKARRGTITARAFNPISKFDTGRTNAVVLDNPDWNQLKVFDVDSGKNYKVGEGVADLQKKFESGNYRLLELEKEVLTTGSKRSRHILVSKGDSTVGPLERNQLPYAAGGRRHNTFKYFIKQSVRETDGTTTHWFNDRTHAGARTLSEARDYSSRMEKARLVWADDAATDAQRFDAAVDSPVEDFDTFKKMWDEGEIVHDTPFEALYDREPSSFRTKIGQPGQISQYFHGSVDLTPEEMYHISKGRMYYSKRGTRLNDPHQRKVDVLNPYKSLQKSLNQAVKTKALSDYNARVIEDWSRFALHNGLIDKESLGGNLNLANVFFNGKLVDGAELIDRKLYNYLQANRAIHKRFMNFKTEGMSYKELALKQISEYIDTKGAMGSSAARWSLDMMDSNPVQAMRAFVFNTTLGMYDIGQLTIQTSQAIMAMGMSGTDGVQAAFNVRVLRHLYMNRSEKLLTEYANKLKSINGFADPEEFKTFVRSWRKSGWANVGATAYEHQDLSNAIGGSVVRRGAADVIRHGQMFFNTAERFNRVIAYQLAWKNSRRLYPKLKVGSKEFLDKVNLHTGDYNWGMTTANKAGWQEGILSIPTQFLSWNVRMMELLLPTALGGNRRIAAKQRAALWASTAALYGTSGIPGTDVEQVFSVEEGVADMYQTIWGEAMPANTYNWMTKGLTDNLMFHLSGGAIDTDFASRAGVGDGVQDVIDKLLSGQFSSVIQVATGAVGSTGIEAVDALRKIVRLARAEQFPEYNQTSFGLIANELAKTISSYDRYQKAWWIWKTGIVITQETGDPIEAANMMDGIAAALGIPLAKEQDFWEMVSNESERGAIIRRTAGEVANLRRLRIIADDNGDEAESMRLEKIVSGMLLHLKYDQPMLDAVIEEVNNQLRTDTRFNNAALTDRIINRGDDLPPGIRP